MTTKKNSIKITFFFFLFSIGCLFIFISLDVFFYTNNFKHKTMNNSVEILKGKEDYLVASIDTTKKILLAINNSKKFKDYLQKKRRYENDINDIFLMITDHDKNIMQLRYINSEGLEQIRVDRFNLNSDSFIVEKSKLQDKSTRYYYKESVNKESKVWFSNLDLNIEQGKVEIPYRPTMRAVLPVKTNNKFNGILIMNYFMENIIANITNSLSHDLIITNDLGYTLSHFDATKSWSYYQKNRFTIKNDFTDSFDKIINNDIFIGDNFVSKKISLDLPQKLIFISKIKEEYISSVFKNRVLHYLLVSAIIILLTLAMSFVFSKWLRNVFLILKDSKIMNKVLSKEIKNKTVKIDKLNAKLEEKIIHEIGKNKQKDIQLIAQSKMASMGEMIENIAHQWKQPLSIISAAVASFKIKKELDELKEEDIDASMDGINVSVQHLSQTIDDFRNFYKPNKVKNKFLINNVFEKTFKLIISQFKTANITIVKNIDEITLVGLENELIQVLINIINNARDELIKKDNPEKLILIDVTKKDGVLEIFIKDNAGGIPDNIIDEVFNSHFTTKEKLGGTGIGLYMSHMIVKELYNGVLEVSNVDFMYDDISYTGAEFRIYLPL